MDNCWVGWKCGEDKLEVIWIGGIILKKKM
jgi:hypothetical protein